jgi:photosystem II stability/assembly factor-like uncharacterized protein
MADPRDDLDAWMNAQVQPLPPPPGTFELIRKRARRRKVTRAAAAAAGAAAVIAVIATVPRLVITQLNVGPGPAASGNAAGNASSAGGNRQHHASASPSAVPSRPTSAPASSPPPAPGNFQATSVTFVGLNTGFVLGQAGTPGQCGPPSRYICTSIAGTGDHGSTWHGVRAPVSGAPAGAAGVSQVRFYNTSDGWAFGPQLWATHDGGQTWTRIRTHGLRVTALETAGQRVFAVWAQCSGGGTDFAADCTSSALYSASPGGDQWAPVPGAGTGHSLSGTASSAALVLTGSRGYLLAPDGTLLSGPVTSAGAWQPATSTGTGTGPGTASSSPGAVSSGPAPCEPGAAQAGGQPSGALLAATTTSAGLVLVCTSPATGATQAKQVYTSADNGQLWQQAGTAPAAGTATSVAGTTAGTIVLATTAGLEVSTDGGATWTAAQGALPSGGFSYVGMTGPQQGVAVPADTAQHAVWFTFDGGRTWRPSPIP